MLLRRLSKRRYDKHYPGKRKEKKHTDTRMQGGSAMEMRRKPTTWLSILIIACLLTGFGASAAWAISDCDMALHYFWKGRYSKTESSLYFYEKTIKLCPGFIRPYELIGNYYCKEEQKDKAIEFFTRAAQLGTNNYKLYYLLASLLLEKGEIDDASRYLKKSLSISKDYYKSLELKVKIEKALDKDGPKIILYEPSTHRGIKIIHKYENITVRGIATDKSGISWVKVNQLDASVDEHGNFLKDIPIRIGTNTIIVVASDGIGNRSNISVMVEGEKSQLPAISKIESSLQMNDLYGESFAVVIGIDNYEKWPSLEFAVADAGAVRQKFKETGFDQITTIFNKEATQRRILTELFYELPKKVGRNDRVVFYFAGHGQTEDLSNGGKRGYIVPVDADTSNYPATAISMEQIRSLSSHISAKHILYVMDSCYSGLGLSRSSGISRKIGDYLGKVSSMRVVQIITAGGKGEQAQEKEGHGLFTRYFLHALDGEADINKDNVVTGTELGAYLRPTVSNASQQAQTPLYGRLEGEGEFLFFVGKK
jgi:tetratricopeptide (TPR) repeat protein